MALTRKKKKMMIIVIVVVVVGLLLAAMFLCKPKNEPYHSGPRHTGSGMGSKPDKPIDHPDRCCCQRATGVPIWDNCGHICGMSKHKSTDLNLSGHETVQWDVTGRKPHGWKHPNQHPDHETCCGHMDNRVPIWDDCGHICSLSKDTGKKMDPHGLTLWSVVGRGGVSGYPGYTASASEAMCPSKTKYFI